MMRTVERKVLKCTGGERMDVEQEEDKNSIVALTQSGQPTSRTRSGVTAGSDKRIVVK